MSIKLLAMNELANSLRPLPIVYFDLDGVIVDLVKEANKEWLNGGSEIYDDLGDLIDHSETVFKNAVPIDGAIDAMNEIIESGLYDVYILSTPAWSNVVSWGQKREWVEKYLPKLFKKIILTHNKDLLVGHYLIDDRLKNGAENFQGVHIHFGQDGIGWPQVKDILGV